MTGQIWSYLNSDDLLLPKALSRVAELFQNPEVDWIGGVSEIFDETGVRGEVRPEEPVSILECITPWKRSVEHVFPCSNATFMRRQIYDRIGPFDESFHYSMDMEYYTRALFAGFKLRRIPEVLGRWRWHSDCKTVRDGTAYRFLEEELRIADAYRHHFAPAENALILSDVEFQRKWYFVRRALSEGRNRASRWECLKHLLQDLNAHPSLLWFRPWLGAVRKQFFIA
jgi:GT2 family glycosyltransferase